ncbi:MAG: hypothetical protein IPK32_21120 [Verrucomicrobiaceae bacterium]|nr:hypothetical protein [Verrucomicrobiaceae bacterium]
MKPCLHPRLATATAIAAAVLAVFGSSIPSAQAQSPVPTAPPAPKIVKDKAAEAAAAIQAPLVITPGPRPVGKLTLPPPEAPGVPAAPPVGTLKATRPAPAKLPEPDKPPPRPRKEGELQIPPMPVPKQGAPGTPQAPTMPPATPPAAPPAPAAALPPPPAPVTTTMSKQEALDAATKPKSDTVVAPSIPLPGDKVPVTSSTSASGQFRVHGKDLATRSRLSSHLDELASELRATLGDTAPHVLPIVVQLVQGEDAARATALGRQTVTVGITEVSGAGFRLEMTVLDTPALTLGTLRRETVRLMLAERVLRGHSQLMNPADRLMLPEWIFTGVMGALDFRAAARPVTLFAAIFKSGKIFGIEEIIEASPTEMDSLSRSIYDTSCSALVMALVEQPQGARRFNTFLNSLAGDKRSERELLSAAYPGFAASASSLNKWWALQMAALAKRGVGDPLNADESLLALEKALTIHYTAKTEEAPKDIQSRPFAAPASTFSPQPPTPKEPKKAIPDPFAKKTTSSPVASSSKAKSSSKSAAKSAETPAAPDEATEEEEEPKKGNVWVRYLTLGLLGDKKDDPSDSEPDAEKKAASADKMAALEKAIAEDKAAEKAAKTASSDAATEESRPGIFSRLFSRQGLKSASEPEEPTDAKTTPEPEKDAKAKAAAIEAPKPAPATTDSKPKTTEKPKSEAKPEPKAEEPPAEKKRGFFDWLRGSKKDEPKAESEAPQDKKPASKDESAALSPAAAQFIAFTLDYLIPPRPHAALLDFLKRKKKTEEPATETPTPPKAPPAASSTSSAKKKAKSKSTTPPRSTNPNAKPAARPVQPKDGSTRTTNPAAKPVPTPVIPPPTTPAADDSDIGKLPPGMVAVQLHLEDYVHIMKRPDRAEILQHNVIALRNLQPQIGIAFRPVVNGYLAVLDMLQRGQTKDVDISLAGLRQAAIAAASQTKAVRDFVDWYEANETEKLSGKFEDFLNLPIIIQKELPPREDPISKYLDGLDREFSR